MSLRIFLVAFTIISLNTFSAIAEKIVVEAIQSQQQLPMSQLYRTFEDSEGYMWYGTQGGGLCRDDGYTIKTFRSDFDSPNLLSSNYINCITEDKKKRIWFGTRRGLYILDKKDYSIALMKDSEIEKWTIDAILSASDSTIWVSSASLLLRYTINEKKIDTFSVNWNGRARRITQIYEDRLHNIWIVQSGGGIFKFSPEANRFISTGWPFKESPTCIIQDLNSEKYWISSWGKGIISFKPEEKQLTDRFDTKVNYRLEPDFSQRHIYEIVQDPTNHFIWAISADNLFSYKIDENGELSPFEISENISSNKMLLNQIISDKKGHIWISSNYPNSFTISFRKDQPHRVEIPEMNKYLSATAAPTVFVYDNNYYWFWQERIGLFLYNPTKDDLPFVSHAEGLLKRRKSPLLERAIHQKGVFTVLDDTAIVLLSHTENKIEIPVAITELPRDERIHRLYATGNNLWIGTSNNVFKYNFHDAKLYKICSSIGVVNDIKTTYNETVYLATEKQGLCKIASDNNVVGLSNETNFSSIAIAENNIIWAGTHQGNVYYFDPTDSKLTSVKDECGLNGDAIIDIESDNSGYIWILTDQRVIIFDPRTKSANVLFNSDPSVSMNNFLSIHKDKNGVIYIGGIGGFLVFPSYTGFDVINSATDVKLTSVRINGKSKLVGIDKDEVILQPNEKNLELFFSTLNPLNADKIRFAFRYRGEKELWNYIPQGQNNIFLTNLSAGDYTLEVKATDKNGQFNNSFTSFYIHRLPAWFETTFAFIFYFIFIIILIVLILYYYLEWKKRKLTTEQLHNSAIDLQEIVSQLSEDSFMPKTEEGLNMKDLLMNLKTILQRQKEQNKKTNITQEMANDEKLLSASDEKFIQQALACVEQNLDNTEYSVEQLSKDLGLDRTGIYRKLVTIIGKTPTSFIRSIRLKRAARLLEEGYTVAETADLVGFGTSSYLSKCFREEFGVNPSVYITTHKQSQNIKKI